MEVQSKKQIASVVFLIVFCGSLYGATVDVETVEQLVDAINNGSAGDVVNVAAGEYLLGGSLEPKAGMTIKGAGRENTVLRPAGSWNPGVPSRYDPTRWGSVHPSAHMFNLNGNDNITISDMELDGRKQLHGSLCGNGTDNLTLHDLFVHDYIICGVHVLEAQVDLAFL